MRYERRAYGGGFYDPPQYSTRDVRHYHLTAEGRAHFVEHLTEYRDLYPDIDAPDLPATDPMPAETGD
ncbi:hypothetical protein [Streptomyces sp. BE133]|uniref:hypothetical protein n=1 Tax=Streptomyces sp. BE133 TaxID=3002523 RepID=UPI002E790B51|nr:hypothetical protein [Streptomyces sp. BE133]MEE1805271.1 hypothetical protein [Streptomyces sp. BE133]